MKEIKTHSYEQFQAEMRELLAKERSKRKDGPGRHFSPLLFRGQSNSEWELETTLDRFLSNEISQNEYHSMIRQLRIDVGTALEISMPIDPDFVEHAEYGAPADYPMMVYARHHGFPSPLLDWTESQYIALFFALASVPNEGDGSSALYVYREYCGNGKSSLADLPHIIGLGPSIKTHRRHFQQKAWYTICVREDDDRKVYAKHEEAFRSNERDQDELWKTPFRGRRRTEFFRNLMK